MIGEEFTFINEARDYIIRELKDDALGLVEVNLFFYSRHFNMMIML